MSSRWHWGKLQPNSAGQPDEMTSFLHVGFSRSKSRPQVQQKPFSSRPMAS